MAIGNVGRGQHGGHVPYGDRYGYNGAGETVSHYYGDLVREFFLGAAAVMLFAAPFYGDEVRAEFPFEVAGALIVVCLAALTNPWKKSILTADAIVAGVGMVVYQAWALNGYGIASYTAFVFREAVSIIFMFAFYFSVKTVRAMLLHQIGKRASPEEFSGASSEHPMDFVDDTASQIKRVLEGAIIGDDDDPPPHKPTFNEKAGD
ncbi:MAG: hypothetical protein Q7S08_01585 [bacterium]|nr:hypothetical protein [bacterium]